MATAPLPKDADAKYYTSEFFAGQVDGSSRSAAVVVPIVLSLLNVRSVIDVGCGVAPWAAEFMAHGITDVCAIDGDYVNRFQLRIPADHFKAYDLTKPFHFSRKFDLAVCLEVGEHLLENRAAGLVDDLVALAPCVLFSAAVPGPTGTNHINSQFLPYWVDLFRKNGYEALDAIRPKIWGNTLVEWFYQQDTVLFVEKNHPAPQTRVSKTAVDHSPGTIRTSFELYSIVGQDRKSLAHCHPCFSCFPPWAAPTLNTGGPSVDVARWDEKAGLRTGCGVRSQVIDVLEGTRDKGDRQ
jgi:SAM-dependent methyltransferase